jgi:hypothetical protein
MEDVLTALSTASTAMTADVGTAIGYGLGIFVVIYGVRLVIKGFKAVAK